MDILDSLNCSGVTVEVGLKHSRSDYYMYSQLCIKVVLFWCMMHIKSVCSGYLVCECCSYNCLTLSELFTGVFHCVLWQNKFEVLLTKQEQNTMKE